MVSSVPKQSFYIIFGHQQLLVQKMLSIPFRVSVSIVETYGLDLGSQNMKFKIWNWRRGTPFF